MARGSATAFIASTWNPRPTRGCGLTARDPAAALHRTMQLDATERLWVRLRDRSGVSFKIDRDRLAARRQHAGARPADADVHDRRRARPGDSVWLGDMATLHRRTANRLNSSTRRQGCSKRAAVDAGRLARMALGSDAIRGALIERLDPRGRQPPLRVARPRRAGLSSNIVSCLAPPGKGRLRYAGTGAGSTARSRHQARRGGRTCRSVSSGAWVEVA